MKRATVNAAGKVQHPKLSTQEQLTYAIRMAADCNDRLQDSNLTPATREIWEESRMNHLRDVARLQKRIAKEAAANG
jgi:hypothetical protein